jgi:drug/metabolite transporter (DMT)-like permease
MRRSQPDPLTLMAFAFVVLIGGSNFIGARVSNRELPPLYGAGVRFGLGALLLIAVTLASRTALPRGRALAGAAVFGVLNFFAAYAFFYWGLQRVPAALAAVMFGAVPLFTFVLSVAQRLESFRWRAVLGATIAIAGVAVMVRAPAAAAVPPLYLIAVGLSAVGAAQAGVVIKRFPAVPPIALTAVAMTIGAALLLAVSAAAGERWIVPQRAATWYALAFLVPVGSVGLFVIYVFVVQRWTASGASYQFVLFPIVTAIAAAIVLGERLDSSLAIGGALVIAGTYFGALSGGPSEVRRQPADRIA